MIGAGRLKRLYNDRDQMLLLHQSNGLIQLIAVDGDPPERYVVAFHCRGVAEIDANDQPVVREDHRTELILTAEYPRVRPLIRWMTPIFHPNFIRGDVCIKEWYPQQPLAELCQVLAEMVQYKNYNTTSPLNMDAALWAMRHRSELPIDSRSLSTPIENKSARDVARSVYSPSAVVLGTMPILPQTAPVAPIQPSAALARFCRVCGTEFATPEILVCPVCRAERHRT